VAQLPSLLAALLLLCVSFYFFRKARKSVLTRVIFCCLVFASVFLLLSFAAAYYFTGSGIDEAALYHLSYGLSGSGFKEYTGLIVTMSGLLLICCGALFWATTRWKQQRVNKSRPTATLLYGSLVASLLFNPAISDLYHAYQRVAAPSQQANLQASASFYQHYKKPFIKSTSNKHKNIVFIYAESLERTYFNEASFPGLIKELRKLEKISTYFTDIRQVSGTGWTVAGMTASQCGIPLATPSHGNSMSGMDRFLSSAVCLGDLLNQTNYQLEYMGGADIRFAGKHKLLKTHGFEQISGRDELAPKLPDANYKTGWGLYDDSLFAMVYQRFTELSQAGGNFGLFTLTLDTHHPNGHPSATCKEKVYGDGSNPILNAVACSDFLIADLVNKIKQSPHADNTLVVVASDHLAMRNTASDLLQKQQRRNLFMIIDLANPAPTAINKVGSSLDIGATVIPFLGFRGEIGLGRNLLDPEASKAERVYIHANLRNWRQPILSFWDFPKLRNSLELNIERRYASIDDRKFKIPMLIEFEDASVSTIKFEFDKSSGHKSLVQHRQEISDTQQFILIDSCAHVSQLDRSLGGNGFCLLAGQGKRYSKIARLSTNISFTADETRNLLTIQ